MNIHLKKHYQLPYKSTSSGITDTLTNFIRALLGSYESLMIRTLYPHHGHEIVPLLFCKKKMSRKV